MSRGARGTRQGRHPACSTTTPCTCRRAKSPQTCNDPRPPLRRRSNFTHRVIQRSVFRESPDPFLMHWREPAEALMSRRVFGWTFAWLLMVGAAAAQQGTTEVRGRVLDSTGASLPGVTVTVRNQNTGMFRETQSGDNGAF